MEVIKAQNVNHAWYRAVLEFEQARQLAPQETRAGRAWVMSQPVATVYARPTERVLFDPVRDANPIFHHMEALWMLAGRDDATWLDSFVKDFSHRFAEESGRMHGAYGKRWRDWFMHQDNENGDGPHTFDQLDEAVDLLKKDPQSRQVVIGMWDPEADLGVPGLKDRPCNTHIYLRTDRLVSGAGMEPSTVRGIDPATGLVRVLDMTVCCRSNDAVFGAYGANAVHMSTLQEYLAARIGVEVGTYTQMSNNLHMYEWSLDKVELESARAEWKEQYKSGYPGTRPLVDRPDHFDRDLRFFLGYPRSPKVKELKNSHFYRVAQPMILANDLRKIGSWDDAATQANRIDAPDWRRATVEWIERRRAGATGKETRE